MKRIYITSHFRRPGERGQEGRIYLFDFDSGQVIKTRETTSLRGMCVHNGKYYIAGYRNDISVFDPDTLEFSDTVYYGGLDFLHKIYSHNGQMWAPSTGNDKIMVLNIEDQTAEIAVDVTRANRDTMHINSLGWDGGENLYCVSQTLGEVLNLFERSTILGPGIPGAHDLEFLDGRRFLVNSSSSLETILGDASEKRKLQTIFTAEGREFANPEAKWGYTRGLALSEHFIFIGSGPVHLNVLDRETFCVGNKFLISDDPAETIFDILLDPRDWS